MRIVLLMLASAGDANSRVQSTSLLEKEKKKKKEKKGCIKSTSDSEMMPLFML